MKKIILCSLIILLSASIPSPKTISLGTVYSHDSAGEQVIAYDAGNSYSLDEDGNVIISYDNDKTIVKAPLTLYPSGSNY